MPYRRQSGLSERSKAFYLLQGRYFEGGRVPVVLCGVADLCVSIANGLVKLTQLADAGLRVKPLKIPVDGMTHGACQILILIPRFKGVWLLVPF